MRAFFSAARVNDHITCIRSGSGELMYLFEGADRALLMDTSVGVYGLRELIDSLTDKPYDLVITHGHIDHAMGAPEFKDKRIYMSHKDLDVYHSMQAVEDRREYVLQEKRRENPDYDINPMEFLPPEELDFIDLKDGQRFDLGGLHIEIIETPGHTQGTVMLLDVEDRVLVSGDAANTFTFMFDAKYSSTITDYRKMLVELKKRVEGRYDHLYLCHHMMESTTEMFDELIQVCDDIFAGKTDDIPFEFMGDKGAYIAKAVDFERFCNADGTQGNIVYRKERV